jgi:hypothetical protein
MGHSPDNERSGRRQWSSDDDGHDIHTPCSTLELALVAGNFDGRGSAVTASSDRCDEFAVVASITPSVDFGFKSSPE